MSVSSNKSVYIAGEDEGEGGGGRREEEKLSKVVREVGEKRVYIYVCV